MSCLATNTMRRYIEHIRSKDPHERRTHALRWAGVVTALFFVAWLGTLPMRLNTADIAAEQSAQAAAATQALYQESAHLEVAPTTYPY